MRVAAPVLSIALISVGGCARRPPSTPRPSAVSPALYNEFLAPPDVRAGWRTALGAIVIEGRAPPAAEVTLASPEGVHLTIRADARGDWRLVLPFTVEPRMYALSASVGGRLVRAEGAVVDAPWPAEPVYLARTGAASMPVYGPAPLRIVAIDYDSGGGAGVAGLAAPGTPVELAIDGVASGAGRSDGHGRFSLLVVRAPLTPGRHLISVRTAAGAAQLAVSLSPASSLDGAPVRVSREIGAWRIDWAPPGGGVQTTLALTPPTSSLSTPTRSKLASRVQTSRSGA